MSLIEMRKRKWIDHVIQGEGMLKDVTKERMNEEMEEKNHPPVVSGN